MNPQSNFETKAKEKISTLTTFTRNQTVANKDIEISFGGMFTPLEAKSFYYTT